MKNKEVKKNIEGAADKYAGVAVNMADREKVSEKLVKEATCEMNNNPRNHGS